MLSERDNQLHHVPHERREGLHHKNLGGVRIIQIISLL